jgi:hypothetical protein
MEIDIKGIDKAELLAALHNGTPAIGMGMLQDRGAITKEQAQEVIDHRMKCGGDLYFDYLFGHPLKSDISKDTMRVAMYDRDAGQGAAERIITKLPRS